MAELVSSKIKVEGLPDNAPTIEIHGDNTTINVNSGDRDQVISELSSQLECAKEANERLTKLAKLANNRYGEIAEAFKRLHAHRETIEDARNRIEALRAQVDRLKDDNAGKQHTIDYLKRSVGVQGSELQAIVDRQRDELHTANAKLAAVDRVVEGWQNRPGGGFFTGYNLALMHVEMAMEKACQSSKT
jgi:chromosome segregation ATPase